MPTRYGHPIKKGDADAIEKVHKRATKLVISLKKLSHIDRLGFSHTQVQKITW